VRRIARIADLGQDEVVLEVGPGLGSLTLALLDATAPDGVVVAVEVDGPLAALLPQTARDRSPDHAGRLTVVHADALRLDQVPGPPPTALVANLPYNVAVPVLLHLWAALPTVRKALVMVQAEVADRLVAGPGSRTYGVPSVKAAWYGTATAAGRVSRSVFWPAPHVDSGLVAWRRHPTAQSGPAREEVFAVVDAAFAQRRKTLRSTLAGLAGSAADAEQTLRAAGVDPGARGEQLPVDDFVRIASALSAAGR
jgi:16S rRNA (adenine1518-N6/adenine1519-N6)-dimethyltransferase